MQHCVPSHITLCNKMYFVQLSKSEDKLGYPEKMDDHAYIDKIHDTVRPGYYIIHNMYHNKLITYPEASVV